ncbi:MAG: hypothetical protein ACN4GM_09030 [Gammaproteobacteria bacterium]
MTKVQGVKLNLHDLPLLKEIDHTVALDADEQLLDYAIISRLAGHVYALKAYLYSNLQ